MIWLMASKRTAFLAFECWTFFDLGGSYNRRMQCYPCPTGQTIKTNVALDTWALFRMVSRHSFNLPWMAGSSIATKESTLNDLLIFSTLVLLLQSTILLQLINWSRSFYWGICLATSYMYPCNCVTMMLQINSMGTRKN